MQMKNIFKLIQLSDFGMQVTSEWQPVASAVRTDVPPENCLFRASNGTSAKWNVWPKIYPWTWAKHVPLASDSIWTSIIFGILFNPVSGSSSYRIDATSISRAVTIYDDDKIRSHDHTQLCHFIKCLLLLFAIFFPSLLLMNCNFDARVRPSRRHALSRAASSSYTNDKC